MVTVVSFPLLIILIFLLHGVKTQFSEGPLSMNLYILLGYKKNIWKVCYFVIIGVMCSLYLISSVKCHKLMADFIQY